MNAPIAPTALASRPRLTPVLLILLALLSAFTPLSIDMYLPALPVIAVDLRGTVGDIQLTLSAFMIAFGAGQIFYGPAGDRFGRRPVILVGLSPTSWPASAAPLPPPPDISCCCASCRGWRRAAAWCWRAPWCAISPSATRRRVPCR